MKKSFSLMAVYILYVYLFFYLIRIVIILFRFEAN